MATDNIKNIAHRGLPYIIYKASRRETLTYKELAIFAGKHVRVILRSLGYIRDELIIPQKLPLLTAIIVNSKTKLPGDNYLPEGKSDLTQTKNIKKFEQIKEEVFNCNKWASLLEELGVEPYWGDEFDDSIELELEFPEGRWILKEHVARERSSKLVKAFKKSLKSFKCQACKFDFEKKYGELGSGFIEAHHIKPIHLMKEGEKVRKKDMIGLCSNCHRMIHKTSPPLL